MKNHEAHHIIRELIRIHTERDWEKLEKYIMWLATEYDLHLEVK